ncbi:aspartate/tyrosine/aromatic aminotransferase [Burkholderia stabilis]|uniref:Aspartate/tyrosine/aromatic aminotransferase n=1 Tax=Burkholderia stabilis TaxID=95485 RepID=A0A4Q2A5H9_9BURK|nr:amino acid aminotransferase [Burkholderia stabilis]RXV64576.1 aspartate/tyrosine/aromatic aminotransferase [Burkholderia stabilis]
MFEHISTYSGDPTLRLIENFHRDSRPNKINLSIGIYVDTAGQVPVMRAVREALASSSYCMAPRPYLPAYGDAQYRGAVQELIFGRNSEALTARRVATLQTIGGSGALRVGADFLNRHFPESAIWMGSPSWEKHRVIFEASGFAVHSYPYYDARTGGLQFEQMLDAIDNLPERSIVLLHACCHNPTGVDLNGRQYTELVPVLQRRRLIAFVDMAYQGFGAGLDEDAELVRVLASSGVPLVVASSFSKNFSLYGERCGALSVVCSSADEAARVLGQLASAIHINYGNPPTHGARLVADVLHTPLLRASWESELGEMSERIVSMRQAIHQDLAERIGAARCTRYVEQRGMFAYTGLTEAQIETLRREYAVYLLSSGRMCVAALNPSNVGYVASSIAAVVAAIE